MESGKKIVIGEVQKEPFMRMLEKDVTVSVIVYSSHIHSCSSLASQFQFNVCNITTNNPYLGCLTALRSYICLSCPPYIRVTRIFARLPYLHLAVWLPA